MAKTRGTKAPPKAHSKIREEGVPDVNKEDNEDDPEEMVNTDSDDDSAHESRKRAPQRGEDDGKYSNSDEDDGRSRRAAHSKTHSDDSETDEEDRKARKTLRAIRRRARAAHGTSRTTRAHKTVYARTGGGPCIHIPPTVHDPHASSRPTSLLTPELRLQHIIVYLPQHPPASSTKPPSL